MKVSFYLQDPKGDDQTTVFMFVYLNGKKIKITTGQKIEPSKWDTKKQLVKITPQTRELAGTLNPLLNEWHEKAMNIYFDKKPKTPEEFKALFLTGALIPEPVEIQKPGDEFLKIEFFEIYERYLKSLETKINSKRSQPITTGTKAQYKAAMETLKRFALDEKIALSFAGIDFDFYERFRQWCLIEEDLEPNTFGSKVKKLCSYLRWVRKTLKLPVNTDFLDFEIPQNYDEHHIVPLKKIELKKLWALKNENWKLDVFLALCSTGMRIGDYKKVMTNMDEYLIETPNGRALKFPANKTGCFCVIPFVDDEYFKPLYLYEKYNGEMPSLTGQQLNKFLEEDCKHIFKRFTPTSKTGRKTMCSVRYYELGQKMQFIMKLTGHQTEKEFRKYVGTDVQSVINEMMENAEISKAS